MITALIIKGPDLSPQAIHRTLKHSKPEAQYKLRCHIQNEQVRFYQERFYLDLQVFMFSGCQFTKSAC